MQLRPDSSTPLFTISDLSRVWVLLNVYETDVEDVKVGEPVTITALAYPDRQYTGTITNISNVVDADTRVLQARVELPNPDGLPKPDTFCTVKLHLEGGGEGLALNPKSVIFSQDNCFVVKQEDPGKYRIVPVRVVQTTSQYTYVTGSLHNGDQVMMEGNLLMFSNLTD